MQENGRMNWLAQIRQMKNRDIRTIEQSELQELQQDAVEHGLPQEERLKNLLDKVRNPYCYLDNGIIVKLNFAPRGSSTLSERIGRLSLIHISEPTRRVLISRMPSSA